MTDINSPSSIPQFLFPDAKADKVDVDKVDAGVGGVPDDLSSSKSDSSQLNEQSKVRLRVVIQHLLHVSFIITPDRIALLVHTL